MTEDELIEIELQVLGRGALVGGRRYEPAPDGLNRISMSAVIVLAARALVYGTLVTTSPVTAVSMPAQEILSP